MFPKIFGNAGDEPHLSPPSDTSGPLSPTSPSAEDTPGSPSSAADSCAPLEVSEDVTHGPTKMAQATDVYRRMTRKKGSTRKEIVAAFIEEVGLTKAGAATYYQMIKKGRR